MSPNTCIMGYPLTSHRSKIKNNTRPYIIALGDRIFVITYIAKLLGVQMDTHLTIPERVNSSITQPCDPPEYTCQKVQVWPVMCIQAGLKLENFFSCA